ncbi:hypothetical protein D9758_001908 [Tetrapyrgos nigripes]|uniref:Ribonuclease H2 subunit B n=1 Tax=Tetrapyrgos nigripes TaxID=182062 RepID=A0A8H5GTN3_9AGAR|nr:hypothetical protein D9758_001908 [Tetrapyrgos nigripes]
MTVHVGVLPTDILDAICAGLDSREEGRFIRLPHPRTGHPCLFMVPKFSPKTILEIQAVDATNPRSWFVGEQIVADGRMLMMLPVDPAFLLIPVLRCVLPDDGSPGTFQPADDILEEAASKLTSMSQSTKDTPTTLSEDDILYFSSLDSTKSAMNRLCDVQDITPEITVWRYSPTKVVDYLRNKVSALLNAGVLDGSRTLIRALAKDGLMEDGNEKLLEAARLKLACDLICQYVPPDVRLTLMKSYESEFKDLNAYLQKLEDERMMVDKPATTEKGGKKSSANGQSTQAVKRKGKAEKASTGVEKLKKANINGMAKLSTFFKKT